MSQRSTSPFTLITGSSMGIGKAMAFECASRGMNLLLVALEEDALRSVEMSVKARYPVEVRTMAIDLTTGDAPRTIRKTCEQLGLHVNFLINNAGLGAGGLFENLSYDTHRRLMDLNNRALVALTHEFLPMMLANRPFHILNTSSIEATMPLPYKSVYTATKNFIYAFSLALNEEVRARGGRVSVLCPGPVPTNAENIRRYHAHGWRARIIAVLPDDVARIALRAALRGKRVIVPGTVNRIIVVLMRFFPIGVKMRILERLFRVYRDHTEVSSR